MSCAGGIRAVVFDLDDTLYRERDYVRSGLAVVARRLGGTDARARRLEQWMWRRFLRGQRREMFQALSRRFDLHLDRASIDELVRLYRRHLPRIRPCRGVPDLLTALRRDGLKLGLLSDGYLPAQALKLQALGLGERFDAVVFTERLGRDAWKPSPRGFQTMRRRLGVPHRCCAYVADNPAKDFLAPNRLGWLTIQWKRSGQVHAGAAAPAGGAPRRVVRTGPQLRRLLLGGAGLR